MIPPALTAPRVAPGGGASAGSGRWLAVLVGVASAAAALGLAAHHPLSPMGAMGLCLAVAAAVALAPSWWPCLLLVLLPLAGLAPWTGWLIVEESDLLVLSVAAGGWLRLALGWPAGADSAAPRPPDRLWATLLWLLPLAVSTVLSMERGVADAGGWSFGWWQGYREPLNSLRLAKPLAEVLLLLPLWRASLHADGAQALRRLGVGMAGLLLWVALGVLWERIAYTGLLDFSSDYRATGPFWEMHVGGAALDAVLALALPFALLALQLATSPRRWVPLAGVLGLTMYAALVTFSRIVYLALPLGLVMLIGLQALARRSGRELVAAPGPQAAPTPEERPSALLVVGAPLAFLAAAAACFPGSGYRGLLALLGAAALLLPAAAAWRGLPVRRAGLGLGLGSVAALAVAAASFMWPKGAYAGYVVAFAAAAAALVRARRQPSGWGAVVALGAWAGVLAAAVAVAQHWGGPAARGPMAGAALGLAAVAAWGVWRPRPAWPSSLRWHVQALGCLLALAAAVGVFQGGAYMSNRLSMASEEAGSRREHWRLSLDLLRGDEWLLGRGLGRFTSVRALSGQPGARVGDYRLAPGADATGAGTALVMSSGDHLLAFGEVLRLSQRVTMPAPGPLRLRLQVLATSAGRLQAEVCEKHLLYPSGCLYIEAEVAGKPGWQPLDLVLKGKPVSRGAWYAPRQAVFSVALASGRTRMLIDHMVLTDSAAHDLLVNGDFEDGLARWFFSSDRWHLPWHAKNLALHLVFEQGLVGLVAFLLPAAAALWRTTFGAARGHAWAPALAAALAGLLVVGAIDSILDMPRVALLTFMLLGIALMLPRVSGRGPWLPAVAPGPPPTAPLPAAGPAG